MLVDFGSDDARILDTPLVDYAVILADCVAVPVGRIG